MKKIIFVNATACTSGGVLTILNQFIGNIRKYDQKNLYYIFSTIEIKIEDENINIIDSIKGKKYLDRIKWDLYGMKKWAITNNVDPNIIISLQNTSVRFKGKQQIVYLHQCLPYSKESKWSLFKSDERKLWFYKNIFKLWIHGSIKKTHYIVVQNNWMKEAILKYGYIDENIIVSSPDISEIQIEKVKTKNISNKLEIFYPAADYKYKNHELIIRAIKKLKDTSNVLDNICFVFTVDKQSNAHTLAKEFDVDKNIIFLGNILYSEVLERYKNCKAVVFPSYIETVGLPLIECACFGKRILVADCEYSRESLSDYKNVRYLNYKDSNLWAEEIKQLLHEYEETPMKLKKKTSWEEFFKIFC